MESSAAGTWKACQDSVKYSNLAEGIWDFRVRAQNPTTGAWSRPPVGRIVTVDTTGPDVRAALRPPQFSGTRDASFIVVPREAVSKMTCSLDDGSSFDCSDGAVSFSGLDEGWHAFDVRATDVLGNQGSTTTFDWKVDLTAPDPEIVDGPAKVTTSTSASFALTSTDEPEWFVCSLDGGVKYPCGVTPSVSDLEVGAHVFDVRAVDRALNVSDPVSWSWTVAA